MDARADTGNLVLDGALTGAGLGLAHKAGRALQGRLAAAGVADSARRRFGGLSRAVFDDAVRDPSHHICLDPADPAAITASLEARPEIGREITKHLLTGIVRDAVSRTAGDWFGQKLADQVGGGEIAEEALNRISKEALDAGYEELK